MHILEYDRAAPEARKAMLESWFSNRDTKRLVRTIAVNRVIRALLEFRSLGVVPFEDYEKLERALHLDRYFLHSQHVVFPQNRRKPDLRYAIHRMSALSSSEYTL